MSPARLYITPEPADDTVGGTFTLAAELTDLPAAASVEYVLNGRSLSGPVQTAPPFAFRWNSAETWDGPAAFRAVVRDAAGATVAESATLDYTVVNGRTQILVAAPGPGRPLSGTVRITVKARRPDVRVTYREATPPDFSAVAFRLYVDGRIHRHPVTGQTLSVVPAESTDHLWATHTFAIDTTRLANGRHELTFVAEAADERVTTVGSVDITTRYAHPVRMAMAQLAVTVDNGAALREIRPRWRELHLALRGGPASAALPVRAVYADDSERAIAGGVTYATSDAKVATVSAAGAVKAVAPGEATVTVTALGRTAEVRVRVRATNDFPHFTRDGEIRATIDRGRSVFVRSLFFMDADQFEGREVALGAQLRHAGVNAISSGFIFPPTGSTTFAAWKADWERLTWHPLKGVADRQNLYLVLTGDPMARRRVELMNSVTNPVAGQAIAHAFEQIAASGRAICVDMIDEANMLWGPAPTPEIRTLMAIINRAARRPPVAFPVLGLSSTQEVANWLGDRAVSEYTSVFYVYPPGDDTRAFPFGASLPQEEAGRTLTLRRWRPALQRDRPVLLMHSVAGPAYEKRAAGTQYQPNRDLLDAGGTQVVTAAAGVLYAVAEGMAGVRVYGFDATYAKHDRSQSAPWSGAFLQTFADPFEVGTDRWQALGSAFSLVQRREMLALQPQGHAPQLGDGIVTGVRSGPEGTLLVAVNFTERAESARVDLSPYLTKDALCIRYDLLGASLGSRRVDGATDAVELAPGMGAAWVVAGAGSGASPTIRLVAPRSGSRVAGRVSLLAEAESSPWPIQRVELRVDGELVATHRPPANTFAGSFHAAWDGATAPRRGVWLSVTAQVHDVKGTMEEARGAILAP